MKILIVLLVGSVAVINGQSGGERQIRLEDIERDNLKANQPHNQQQQPQVQYQTPTQYQQPQYQQYQQYLPQQQLFSHPQYSQAQLGAYHQQLLLAQQNQQPVYIPQHQPLPFPIMLIPSPYLFPQDVNSLVLQGQQKYRPAQIQQLQSVKPFRASPQVQYNGYTPQYNAYQTIYQQKYATGAKSTVSPPLKDNYVQPSNYNYKLQIQ